MRRRQRHPERRLLRRLQGSSRVRRPRSPRSFTATRAQLLAHEKVPGRSVSGSGGRRLRRPPRSRITATRQAPPSRRSRSGAPRSASTTTSVRWSEVSGSSLSPTETARATRATTSAGRRPIAAISTVIASATRTASTGSSTPRVTRARARHMRRVPVTSIEAHTSISRSVSRPHSQAT